MHKVGARNPPNLRDLRPAELLQQKQQLTHLRDLRADSVRLCTFRANWGGVLMERFYFHIRADGIFVPDEEGMNLPDAEAAAAELRASARDLCSTHPSGFIEMTDALGKVLTQMPARAVMH